MTANFIFNVIYYEMNTTILISKATCTQYLVKIYREKNKAISFMGRKGRACGTSDQAKAAVTEQGIGPDTDGVFFI